MREQKEKDELNSCTFKPKTTVKGERTLSRERIEHLAKPIKFWKEKKDRPSIEIEFEKAKDECIFMPNLNRKSQTSMRESKKLDSSARG